MEKPVDLGASVFPPYEMGGTRKDHFFFFLLEHLFFLFFVVGFVIH